MKSVNKKTCNIILLPHELHLQANSSASLMEVLVENRIFLRSDCGGKGVCRKCLVEIAAGNGDFTPTRACIYKVREDISVRIPESSLLSAHIIDKAPVSLPSSFIRRFSPEHLKDIIPGIAVDLGTTTIALYLCDIRRGTILSSVAVKNPQALYGDDVMSRIGEIGQDADKLVRLQQLVIRAIEWGTGELCRNSHINCINLTRMVIVGNPAMIHILQGVSPASIGVSPYLPQFFEAKNIKATELGMSFPDLTIDTLPQVSGFIGGDTIAAVMAVELEKESVGTLLIDLGTNGELVLKGKNRYYTTSCATGPAFEGAALSCGMQAIPGAIDRVTADNSKSFPDYSLIQNDGAAGKEPLGICGSGVISAIAWFCRAGIVERSGLFSKDESILPLTKSTTGGRKFVIVPAESEATGKEVAINQKDIRAIQLGKAALITGIEFLLKAAAMDKPKKIIVAGAFGSYLNKNDILTLGMVPPVAPETISMAGNSAGAGAIMALCENHYIKQAQQIADTLSVIDLATNRDFQNAFVQHLAFPEISS